MAGRLLRRLPTALAVAAILFGWIGLNLSGEYFRDALAYWRPNLDDLYGGRQVGVASTYLYSPAFAQLISPLGLLPFPAFALLWSGLSLALLVWMVGPVVAALLFLVPLSPVADEISTGNIHLLLAAAIVIGLRHPWAWAVPLLTKVTPGVGVLWFAGSRRWRSLLGAVAAAAGIALVSFVLSPGAWVEWVETLRRSSEVSVSGAIAVIPGPLWARTLVGGGLAVAAGALNRPWLVPVAVTIALPVPWSSGLSVLVASLALTRETWRAWPARAADAIRGRAS